MCEHPDPLADETCIHCLRIDDGNYADFMLVDGSLKTIKKEDVQAIESNFEKTSVEPAGRLIYILHLVENMTVEAVNSLLKFLEEPGKETYAILTTENDAKVLPTILSRTQQLHLHLLPRQMVIDDALALSVERFDAELLSYFFNDGEALVTKAKDEDYINAKTALLTLLESLKTSLHEGVLVSQTQIAPLLKSKESARFYLDMLAQVFRDIMNLTMGLPATLTSVEPLLVELSTKLNHPQATYLELMNARGQIDLNLNLPLLLDHVMFTMIKETYHV
ncbi:MAG: hypothetical protein EOM74_03380 [Methanomicrobia archaeon]|nr:hypothetical protein [Methanomicrobia archaeon]